MSISTKQYVKFSVEIKREFGEIPKRSRHCDRELDTNATDFLGRRV
jgi:hypothetical protein